MPMIPRGRPDIGWCDLFQAMLDCTRGGELPRQITSGRWAAPSRSLACLSLRSGFDAVLRVLALPHGSKVLVSEVTIPDMIRLLEHHGLTPVPLSVDQRTLAVDERELESRVDAHTRAVLIAHLFGSRMPMDGIVTWAKEHGLMVFEDCAQAFDGGNYRGHAVSDVAMFSFGPIKTATALGGAMLVFREESLFTKTAVLCGTWPPQSRAGFLKRLLKFAVIKLVATETGFGLFHRGCRLAGRSHDEVLRAALRGFSGDLFTKIRQRPCDPLLRLLSRRLSQPHEQRIKQRAKYAQNLRARLNGVMLPGCAAAMHTHWVLPVRSRDPAALVTRLQSAGFDATRYGSSLAALGSSTSQLPHWIQDIVYLPMQPEMSERKMETLARLVPEQEARP